MFNSFNRMRLPDERAQNLRARFAERVALGLVATGLVVSTLFTYLNRDKEEEEGPYEAINNAFCTDSTVRPPYLSWAEVPFRIDWDNSDKQNVQTFTYDFNEITQSNEPDNTIEGFAASIPQEIRDDPNKFLVITGHASRDVPDVEFVPGEVPKTRWENSEIRDQRAINNRKIARGRIDNFVAVLDWPEDRMRKQNLETANNKREINVQLCDLSGLE